MKHLFLLIIIAVLSSCHEPYFENAFTEGVEYKQLPVEIQGKYLVINRFLDGDNNKVIYTIDTAQDS
ncbi:MAG TPA: hypothetical protein VEC12_11330, partial [Bacteroidia bacterium]|nr:hypothetical protein [Bacteroidia bacterium]